MIVEAEMLSELESNFAGRRTINFDEFTGKVQHRLELRAVVKPPVRFDWKEFVSRVSEMDIWMALVVIASEVN